MALKCRRSPARPFCAIAMHRPTKPGLAVLSAAALFASAAAAAPSTSTLPLKPGREIDFTTQEGTWLSPDLSPDSSQIAFELLGDLYVLDARGGAARAIATGVPFDSQPAFAPNGKRIAFLSDRLGPEDVWISAPDGSEPRPLTHFAGDTILTSPAWSADGRTIFVSRYHPEYVAFELLSVDVATGRTKVVLPVGDAKSSSTVGATASRDGRWL